MKKKEIVILLCVLFAVAIAAGYLMYRNENLKSNLELLCGKWRSTEDGPSLLIVRDQENFWIIVRRELSGGRIEERSYRLEQQDYGGVTFDDGQEVNLFYFPKNGRMLVLPGYGEYEREIFTLTIPFYYEK